MNETTQAPHQALRDALAEFDQYEPPGFGTQMYADLAALLTERDALAAVAEAAEEVDGAWYVEDGGWTYREDVFEPRLTKLRQSLATYDRAVSKP